MSPPGKAAANVTQAALLHKETLQPPHTPQKVPQALLCQSWSFLVSLQPRTLFQGHQHFAPLAALSSIQPAGNGFQMESALSLLGLGTQRKALALSLTSFIWFTKQVCVTSLALQHPYLLLALLKSQAQSYAYGLYSLPLPPAVLGSEFWDTWSPKAS